MYVETNNVLTIKMIELRAALIQESIPSSGFI